MDVQVLYKMFKTGSRSISIARKHKPLSIGFELCVGKVDATDDGFWMDIGRSFWLNDLKLFFYVATR